MLEKMEDFFDARLDGYEEHQLNTIASAKEFYPFTAGCLPRNPGPRILDLGCGTGLELGYYFEAVPPAAVTFTAYCPSHGANPSETGQPGSVAQTASM